MGSERLFREEVVKGSGDSGDVVFPLVLYIDSRKDISPRIVGDPLSKFVYRGLFQRSVFSCGPLLRLGHRRRWQPQYRGVFASAKGGIGLWWLVPIIQIL